MVDVSDSSRRVALGGQTWVRLRLGTAPHLETQQSEISDEIARPGLLSVLI